MWNSKAKVLVVIGFCAIIAGAFFCRHCNFRDPINNNKGIDGTGFSQDLDRFDIDGENGNENRIFDKLYTSTDATLLNSSDQDELLLVAKFKIIGHQEKGSRHLIMYRFEQERVPHAGWAMAIWLDKGRFRPQFYYRSTKSKGGWFSMEEVGYLENQAYTLIIAVRPNSYGVTYLLGNLSADGQPTDGNIRFMGGFDVSGIDVTGLKSELIVNRATSVGTSSGVEVSAFLIGNSDFTNISRAKVKEAFISGGGLKNALNISRVVAFSGNF